MDIIKIDKTDSTNNWLAEHEKELNSPSLVYCVEQTAGRGQRGNSWESEKDKNITASLLFHPLEYPALKQFAVSEAVALAILEFLAGYGIEAKVKWPNDIYVGDEKICGILVEHIVTGKNLTRTIAGFGININQKEFRSNAPNPVSLYQLTGKEHDIEEGVRKLASILQKNIERLNDPNSFHEKFVDALWRGDGNFYKFLDHKKNEMITARIKKVGFDGILSLVTSNEEEREFFFKEVEFILE